MTVISALAFAAMLFAGRQGASQVTDRTVTFRFRPPGPAKSVCVTGQFNNWDKALNPLVSNADGTWSGAVRMKPGVYQYLYVIDGARWVNDPDSPHADDGNGNTNSVLVVTPPDYDSRPGVKGDGIITESAVRHAGDADVVRKSARLFTVRLTTRHNDVQSVMLAREIGNGSGFTGRALRIVDSDPLYDYWQGTLTWDGRGAIAYWFFLSDGPHAEWAFDSQGLKRLDQWNSAPLKIDPARIPLLTVPDWVRDTVFYQIFPDRFANGEKANDPPNVQPWGSKPTSDNWMGGDLRGVMQRMDYLRDLGINGLYFNPIFRAESNHGYDTTDYHRVDPRFGTNADLRELVVRCHQAGWRVILDGVFNHTSPEFFAFQDVRARGTASHYKGWYYIKRFPVVVAPGQQTYVGWAGVHFMPKLRVDDPAARRYLLDVGVRWIRDAGIDGWRLDTADELTHSYWKAFRTTVRAARKDAYIVGEIWGDAHAWLQGDELDSVMNYRWRKVALDFFVHDRIRASELDSQLARIRSDYQDAATYAMFNILGSHDTERLRTLCRGDARRHRQCALFQMAYPGVPCIYYGDEIGLEGGRDPDDRRCMPWSDMPHQDLETRRFYQRIIGLRRRHVCLRRGDYRTIAADDRTGLYGFSRCYGRDFAIVLFNQSDAPTTAALTPAMTGGRALRNWLAAGSPAKVSATVILPPRGYALFGTNDDRPSGFKTLFRRRITLATRPHCMVHPYLAHRSIASHGIPFRRGICGRATR